METDSRTAACPDMTPAEREKAVEYLAEARKGLAQAIEGLSEKQWRFKPSPDCWSVAENVEHLSIVSNRVLLILERLEQSPATEPGYDREAIATRVIAGTADRSQKFQAPPHIAPTGLLTIEDAFQKFLEVDRRVVEAFDSSLPLRGRVVSHPVLGPLEGYEWILIDAAHNVRHTNQILELKAHPQFPPN